MPNYKLSICAVLLFFIVTANVNATTNLLFILDSSGSMWGKVDNATKMDTAKAALKRLSTELPADSNVGLVAYGHRKKGNCKDVEVLLPVGTTNESLLIEALSKITPLGKTPMAYSLEQASAVFGGRESDNNNVVLISDGIETCGGDPCAVAGKLAAANINLRVHVVGFDISEENRAKLQCIADQGKGKYFSANSTQGFKNAIQEALAVAQKPEPPPKPTWKVTFEDNFDGEELAEHWTVKNPDPDAYIVEDGELMILSSSTGDWKKDTVQNIMLVDFELPKTDWRMTAKFRGEFGAAARHIVLGAVKDKDNSVSTGLLLDFSGGWDWKFFRFYADKTSKGKSTGSNEDVLGKWVKMVDKDPSRATKPGKLSLLLSKYMPKSNFLRLRRVGRSYISEVKFGDDPKSKWITLPKLTALRPLGKTPFFAAQKTNGKYNVGGGEDIFFLDWIKIEQLVKAQAD